MTRRSASFLCTPSKRSASSVHLLLFLNSSFLQVVTHCSHGQLETVADTLWTPLFENSENQEETTRNVAAACLGKLTTTHPGRYLPQLHVSGHYLHIILRMFNTFTGPHQRPQPCDEGNGAFCHSLHVRRECAPVRRGTRWCHYGLPVAPLRRRPGQYLDSFSVNSADLSV